MSIPTAEVIERSGTATAPDDGVNPSTHDSAEWDEVQGLLRGGSGPFWLSLVEDHTTFTRPLVRPVFAAWTGSSFVFASNPGARKTSALNREGHCSIAIDLDVMHFVLDGVASRLFEPDLERASAALKAVFDWPTEVTGDLLDAPYAAPTSGGPPFEVFEVQPVRAYAFPTADQFEPTRWRWDV